MAATTGIINGTDLLVYTGNGATPEVFTAVTHSTSASISWTMDVRDASTKDSGGYKESLEGQRSWTIECEGMTAFDASNGFEALYAIWVARDTVTVKFGTDQSEDQAYSGTCYITSLSVDSGVEDSSSFSVSFEGTGAITAA
jgi:TP901-1 family phage major tail protein